MENVIMNKPATERMTARDIMKTKVLTVEQDMTTRELAAFLTNHGISGAPVVNQKAEIVGVVSATDLVTVDVDRPDTLSGHRTQPEFYDRSWDEARHLDEVAQIHIERDGQLVKDVMTPTIFSVKPEALISEVAEMMVRGRIHRVLVIDRTKQMLGIITALDLLTLLTPDR